MAKFFRKFSILQKDTVITDESWDVRMDGDMVIAGLIGRTREAYLRAVRQLATFHRRADPGSLEEEHVKDYLLWLRTEKRAAPGTLTIAFTITAPLTNTRDE
ncbi:MAG: phage integrase N-terminal SAM-like domain-containing protein [Planctomycetaceae bacterium]|nr:phage integrase N-terminal SAM-like domain-containing protein [Planctomycetaceae bacterium]